LYPLPQVFRTFQKIRNGEASAPRQFSPAPQVA